MESISDSKEKEKGGVQRVLSGKERGRMSEIKLNPCPFCGSENLSEGSRIFDFVEDIHIRCIECGAKIQICMEYGWDELRKRWNRRTENETD